MSIPVPLRSDFDADALRRAAKVTRDAAQGRRLLALAEIYDGGTRTDAARIGGVGLQTIRDWVLAFNREGPDGLVNGKAPGQPSKLNDAQRRALAGMVGRTPITSATTGRPRRRRSSRRSPVSSTSISASSGTGRGLT